MEHSKFEENFLNNVKIDTIPADAFDLEVFSIKEDSDFNNGKAAYIGFKIKTNNNFHYIKVPYNNPNENDPFAKLLRYAHQMEKEQEVVIQEKMKNSEDYIYASGTLLGIKRIVKLIERQIPDNDPNRQAE